MDWLGGWRNLTISRGEYNDGTVSLVLDSLDEGPVATVTVNLGEYGLHPTPGCFWIKNYSEAEGLGDALAAAGVVVPTGRGTVAFGPYDATATEFRLAPEYDGPLR